MNAIDKFAQIEAQYKAIKKLYDAQKKALLKAGADACGPGELESTIDGDEYFLNYKMGPVMTFSKDRAIELGYLTEEEYEASKVQSSRETMKVELKPAFEFAA